MHSESKLWYAWYTSMWNVLVVLQYLVGLGPSDALTLKQPTLKVTMFMCLTRLSRSADLASLQLDRHQFKPEGVVFLPPALAKESSQGRVVRELFFPSFPKMVRYVRLRLFVIMNKPQLFWGLKVLANCIVKPHKPHQQQELVLLLLILWMLQIGSFQETLLSSISWCFF